MKKNFLPTACENCDKKDKSIFCTLSHSALSDLTANKAMNRYKKGDVIFFQGNPVFGIHCINKGKIKVTRHCANGKETILRIAGPGDIVGHRSLFSGDRYAATGTVMEDTDVCFFDKTYFFRIVKQDPELAFTLLKKMSNDMGNAESRSVTFIQKSVEERLAEFLLTLGESYGVDENGHIRIDIRLSREEIASIIGTASETVIRSLSLLKAENVIDQQGKVLYIVNRERLTELAGA